MKKLLALVLALVMSMSLVTISNAAFKDADKIDYKEAVDVMNAVGVFIGDEKGNFNAKENLTREQAAKIIAYLELGSKAADALVGSGTFADVAASRWSAGFVGYCAQAGVVAGVGDGKFDPAGQLTALQFGKMLLVEIGYDAKAAGMTGTDWAINTSKLMATTGLMKGIDGSVNQVLTREKAAQMTLNALKTPTVEYATKGSSVTVNGAEINFGASVPTYVTNTIAKEQTISKDKLTNSGEYTIELGEKLYKDLKLVKDTTDAFERPTHEWYLKTTKIGTYAETPDATYTAEADTGDIYKDLGLSKGIDDSKVSYFVDGVDRSSTWTWDIVKGDKDNSVGGNGVLLDVYYDDDAETVRVVEIHTYVAEIAATYKATSTKDAYVTLNPKSGSGASYETDDSFAKDDIVLYTYSNKTGDVGVQSMVKAQAVTGTLKGYTVGKNVTVDGTLYKQSKYGDGIGNLNTTINKEVTVYLDEYGYAAYIDADTDLQYAVVLDYASKYGLNNARVKLLLTDGTTVKVDVDKIYDYSGTSGAKKDITDLATLSTTARPKNLDKYDIVSYTVNSDDEYTLTLAGDWESVVEGAERITNGSPIMKLMPSNNYNVGKSGSLIANGKTIFLVMDETGTDTTYSVYTGIANVPTVTLAGGSYTTPAAVVSENDTTAKVVFLCKKDSKVNITDQNKDVTLIKGKDVGQSYTKELGYFYEYDAVINGEETTIKTNNPVQYWTLVSGVAYNSKGVVTGYNDFASLDRTVGSVAIVHNGTNVKTGVGTIEEKNGVIGLNGTYYAYSDDCKVYYINTDGELTLSTAASITDDANDQVWFKLTDGSVSTVFIKVVDKAETVTATAGKLSSVVLSNDSAGNLMADVTLTDNAAALTNTKVTVQKYMEATDKWVDVATNVTVGIGTGYNYSGAVQVLANAAVVAGATYRAVATLDGASITSVNFTSV